MRIKQQGILHSEPAGSTRSVGTFATITPLTDGSLLATYRVGSTKDADDETVELRWSVDGGLTWSDPATPFESQIDGIRGSLKVIYLTVRPSGQILACSMWVDRQSHPGQPLFNDATEGCLPMKVLIAESDDHGHTWSPWRVVPMPEEVGPPSLTSPALLLPSGRIALSIETNKTYHDTDPWMQRVVYVESADGGQSWNEPRTTCQDPSARIFHWDQRAGVCPDGRLVTFTWTYDRQTTQYLNIQRRISADEGHTWTEPEDLGFADQAACPAIFPDGRIVLAWVDRFGTRSIRARRANAVDAPFAADSEVTLYRQPTAAPTAAGTGHTGNLLAEMGLWNFGLPYATALPDGDAMVVFYAGSSEAMQIHWARLDVA